jgi:hypothetical protein
MLREPKFVVSHQALPPLIEAIPFRRLQSGQNPVILAAGDLTLDLSGAQLRFPDGRNAGNAHVQLLPRELIPFRAQPSVSPHWLYSVQPADIAVSGTLKATLAMPALYGSYDYLPEDGTYVLMVGFDSEAKQLTPIGVGQVERALRRVVTRGALRPSSLGYIGYALKGDSAQAAMSRYANGEIGFEQLIIALDQLAE